MPMRIISGSARGRKLLTPEGLQTRPTLDRVKEALFGAIAFDLPQSNVLDLFAGSGNLGLEALSRGCALCVLNDASRSCCDLIAQNAKALQLAQNARVTCLPALRCLEQMHAQALCFDIIFLDPPYASQQGGEAIERILALQLLKPAGKIILEHPFAQAPPAFEALGSKTKKYGKVGVTTYAPAP